MLDTQFEAKFKLTSINIDSVSNINDIEIKIRGAKENQQENVWTEWKTVDLSNGSLINENITFDGYRFFQISVRLKNKGAYVRIKNIDLKVVN